MENQTDILKQFNIRKYDSILARGLCNGVGSRDGQMCIEAAICATLDLKHGDDPQCVAEAVRSFKISLNDLRWSSPEARAKGLRDLGIAQLGSKGVVSNVEFATNMAIKSVRVLVPELFRLFKDQRMLDAIPACEAAETIDAASDAASAACYAARYAASDAASAARYAASDAASDAASAARYAASAACYAARDAASAARYAASAACDDPDYFLRLMAKLALDVLIELKSPGVELLDSSGSAASLSVGS